MAEAKYVTVASLGDIPEGTVRTFFVGSQHLALARVAGNEVYAFQDVCTHDGGPLGAGELDGYLVECPRHGARFDIKTGAVRSFPAVVGIETYRVRIEGEEIQVALPEDSYV